MYGVCHLTCTIFHLVFGPYTHSPHHARLQFTAPPGSPVARVHLLCLCFMSSATNRYATRGCKSSFFFLLGTPIRTVLNTESMKGPAIKFKPIQMGSRACSVETEDRYSSGGGRKRRLARDEPLKASPGPLFVFFAAFFSFYALPVEGSCFAGLLPETCLHFVFPYMLQPPPPSPAPAAATTLAELTRGARYGWRHRSRLLRSVGGSQRWGFSVKRRLLNS